MRWQGSSLTRPSRPRTKCDTSGSLFFMTGPRGGWGGLGGRDRGLLWVGGWAKQRAEAVWAGGLKRGRERGTGGEERRKKKFAFYETVLLWPSLARSLGGVGVWSSLLAESNDDVDESSVVQESLVGASLWNLLLLLLGHLWRLATNLTGTRQRTVNFSCWSREKGRTRMDGREKVSTTTTHGILDGIDGGSRTAVLGQRHDARGPPPPLSVSPLKRARAQERARSSFRPPRGGRKKTRGGRGATAPRARAKTGIRRRTLGRGRGTVARCRALSRSRSPSRSLARTYPCLLLHTPLAT